MSLESPEAVVSGAVEPCTTPVASTDPTDLVDELASTEVDPTVAKMMQRAARRADPDWSVLGTLEAAERMVAAAGRHVDDGHREPELLEALVALRDLTSAVINTVATTFLEDGDSYGEVGEQLGISKQAAAKRFPQRSGRPSGGQRAGLR